MIRLEVQDYCQECPAFDPVAVTSVLMNEDGEDQKLTQVCCARRELCANVARRARTAVVKESIKVLQQAK